jgi:hypothetical protein
MKQFYKRMGLSLHEVSCFFQNQLVDPSLPCLLLEGEKQRQVIAQKFPSGKIEYREENSRH